MSKYSIKIELLSETILGSGESVAGYLDLDVLHDELGLPYFKAKTLKGRLREEAENLVRLQTEIFKQTQLDFLFGCEDNYDDTVISLGNCEVTESIKKAVKLSKTSQQDIIEALTDIRTFTSIGDNGVAKKGSLRQIRVINKGLKLYSDVTFRSDIDENDLLLFGLTVISLKHIGLMCNRGKGLVKCSLLEDGVDITKRLLSDFKKRVK